MKDFSFSSVILQKETTVSAASTATLEGGVGIL